MKSVFLEKESIPTEFDLKSALGDNYDVWKQLAEFTQENYPEFKAEWNYSSAKFGWSYRIKDEKRVIIYLLPRAGFFKIAFVFGQKAIDSINESTIIDSIKSELNQAKFYAEGKGIRIEVKNRDLLNDLKKLILIKLNS